MNVLSTEHDPSSTTLPTKTSQVEEYRLLCGEGLCATKIAFTAVSIQLIHPVIVLPAFALLTIVRQADRVGESGAAAFSFDVGFTWLSFWLSFSSASMQLALWVYLFYDGLIDMFLGKCLPRVTRAAATGLLPYILLLPDIVFPESLHGPIDKLFFIGKCLLLSEDTWSASAK